MISRSFKGPSSFSRSIPGPYACKPCRKQGFECAQSGKENQVGLFEVELGHRKMPSAMYSAEMQLIFDHWFVEVYERNYYLVIKKVL